MRTRCTNRATPSIVHPILSNTNVTLQAGVIKTNVTYYYHVFMVAKVSASINNPLYKSISNADKWPESYQIQTEILDISDTEIAPPKLCEFIASAAYV